jgi:hypothetical protein
MTPAPHARKRPNITIAQLQALKKLHNMPNRVGRPANFNVCQALVTRRLADWVNGFECIVAITSNGLALIETQYESLKTILEQKRFGYR